MFDIVFDLILELINFIPGFIVVLVFCGFVNGVWRR